MAQRSRSYEADQPGLARLSRPRLRHLAYREQWITQCDQMLSCAYTWITATVGHDKTPQPAIKNQTPKPLLASQQWRLTRQRLLDRASLLWFLLTVFLSIGFDIALYLGPTLFGEDSQLTPQAVVVVSMPIN